ncbi:MAG: hypothetical protein C4519_24415 [Desulfobacteraceae bacterium]|nr:MAG: hypothetical protein C4519_24415 [Desulfobacteraceae bacterium]
MSDIARPKSSGDELSVEEVNHDLPVQGTGGETIGGATTPAPVFISSVDGELYECDSNDATKLLFIGFVVNNTSDGIAATLQKNGVVPGFSGLSAGLKYYVQDSGGIGTTPGTYVILVGIALSATELLIIKEEFEESVKRLIASDNVKKEDNAEENIKSETYTELKEFKVRVPGTVKVKFEMKQITSETGPYNAYATIYINGSAAGTQRASTSTSYIEYEEDITIGEDDIADSEDGALVELYVRSGHNVYCTAYVKNYSIGYDVIKKSISE